MKCSKCGSNLAMENAYCPYCGAENQFAKQHRADMAKYAKDYNNTKEEVIGNSKRFNKKTFRITAIAVTVTAIVLLAFFTFSVDNLAWEKEYRQADKESITHLQEVETLVANDDYMGLYELINKYDIRFRYDTPLYAYVGASNVASYYKNLYLELLYIKETSEYERSSYANRIAENYTYLMEEAGRNYYDDSREKASTFASHAYSDAGLLLKTYLGLTDEDLASWENLSLAGRNLLVEEAYNRVKEEK